MSLQHLGVQLIWATGQVTLLLSLGAVLYLAAKRRGPAMRSLLSGGALSVALAMTVLALSPWPRWCNVSLVGSSASQESLDNSLDERGKSNGALSAQSASSSEDQTTAATQEGSTAASKRKRTELENPMRAAASAFWQTLQDNLITPVEADGARPHAWQWPAAVAVVFLVGLSVAVARLLVGLWAIRRYRQSARRIGDPQALAELAELRSSLGCGREVVLCESETIGTPATIGWLRPLVLLPTDWRQWNPIDRRAVLAHELAHVARGDFLTGVIARLATAVHFYHPLALWLARRMRFEQELAADACGVACTGGKECYVVAIARVALAQDNRALAWAARPFLPNRSTFLRRIEMLRNTSAVQHVPYRPATRRLALATLMVCALVIVGLRGPIASRGGQALAQAGAANNAAAKVDLTGVPEDTVLYAVVRLAAIFQRDAKLKEMIGVMEKQLNLRENTEISPLDVEEFRLMMVDLTVPGERLMIEPVLIVRTINPQSAKDLTAALNHSVVDEYRGQKFFRRDQLEGGPRFGWSYFMADERTLVMAPTHDLALRKYIDAVKDNVGAPRWAADWKRVDASDAALAVDVKFFGKLIDKEMERGQSKPEAMALALAPLWRQTSTLVAGAKIDGTLKAEAHAICKSEKGAEEVQMTVNAGKILLQNMLPLVRRQIGGPDVAEVAKLKADVFDQAEKFLAQVKPTRDGDVVTVKIEGYEAFGPMVAALLLPAVAKAREASQRAQSTNNLKQIALAMHSYADVHKAFPAAVMLGPDGKTKHSWRVAILPYIEQESLYKQYNFNEPWDSENNKKLLDRMPPVYRHPSEAAKGTSPSYFALTGKGGIFSEDAAAKGTSFSQIRDGTSNTVLLVEAKRDIPWTKPEDIPFDTERDVPKLGGFAREGFAAALADGSVHFINAGVDAQLIKAMFTASGNEPVTVHEALHPQPRALQRGATEKVLTPRATAPPAAENAPPSGK